MAGSVVKATLTADARQFQAGFKKAEDATKGFDKKISNTADLAKGFLAGAAATAVIGFAKQAVQAFSSVEQSAGSVESVFGAAADKITSQAEGAAEAFGLSASEFQSSAALIGSMLKNQLGLSADQAADKVDDLTGKAADMAATFGGTTSDAISAIGSLMRGERDPIERYGVSMSDASIQAYALEKGLAASTDEMTPQIKATAALDLLFEQTADSAGQFARESETLAGQQQRLTAKIENAKAAIGEELAPAVGLAMDAVDLLIPVVESLTSAMGGAAEETQPLIDELTTLIGIAPESGIGLESVGSALATTILPFLAPVIGGLGVINELLGRNADKNKDALRGMEDARTHGLEPLAEATGELTAAMEDARTHGIGPTTEAIRAQFDLIDGRLDTFANYTGAVDDQAAAQQAVLDAIDEFGKGSPEHIAALEGVATANRDVADAEIAVTEEGGLTRAEFIKQQTELGLTREEAQLLADKYDELFTPRTVTHTIRYDEQGYQGSTYGRPPNTQQGGYVPQGVPRIVGEKGPEIFTPNANGFVTPNAGIGPAMNGGGSAVYNVTINAGMGSDPNAISKAIVEALQRYQRANGAVPIRTRP